MTSLPTTQIPYCLVDSNLRWDCFLLQNYGSPVATSAEPKTIEEASAAARTGRSPDSLIA